MPQVHLHQGQGTLAVCVNGYILLFWIQRRKSVQGIAKDLLRKFRREDTWKIRGREASGRVPARKPPSARAGRPSRRNTRGRTR